MPQITRLRSEADKRSGLVQTLPLRTRTPGAMGLISETPQWKALQEHAAEIKQTCERGGLVGSASAAQPNLRCTGLIACA